MKPHITFSKSARKKAVRKARRAGKTYPRHVKRNLRAFRRREARSEALAMMTPGRAGDHQTDDGSQAALTSATVSLLDTAQSIQGGE